MVNQLKLFVNLILNDRYKIINQLGTGGMGIVFEALDLQANQQRVAIKQMLPLDTDLRDSFQREAAILSRLDHPQIPSVFETFETENGLFMAMEFVAGLNLGQLLNSRQIPFTPHQVKLWALDLLQILDYLHNQTPHITHRDIKPANIKLAPDGHVVLLDFGLAKEDCDETDDESVCILAYTPNYAPPEQIQGMPTDTYSDLYALGATLYHLITGTAPVDALKRINQKRATQKDPLRSISELIKGVPQTLASLIMKSLSLDPRQRPASAKEMLEQLTSGIIAPAFTSEETITAARSDETITKLAGKPSILSRNHQTPAGATSHSRIAIDLTEPTVEDFRTKRVVSLAAYKKASQPASAGSIRKIANIASMILILSLVGYLSTSVYRSDINPLRISGTTPNEFPASGLRGKDDFDASVKPSRLLRPVQSAFTEAVYLTNAPALPPSISLDDLARFRARYLKRRIRTPRRTNHTAQTLNEIALLTVLTHPAQASN